MSKAVFFEPIKGTVPLIDKKEEVCYYEKEVIIMPRTARRQSGTKIYHVMMRGNNKQDIFHDEEDYYKMIQLFKYCIEKSGIEIYAYCLMSNHFHLLLKEGNEPLGITFRRLGSKYVYWHNTKYNRVGHLFQDRFKSEAVEDDSYFLTVLRYIHQNPIKAGIVKFAREYPYSSYTNYFFDKSWINKEKALSMITLKQFENYHNMHEQVVCLDVFETPRKGANEKEAEEIFFVITGCKTPQEFELIDKGLKQEYIQKMRSQGLTIRQIAELTGETFYKIQKQKSIKEPSP